MSKVKRSYYPDGTIMFEEEQSGSDLRDGVISVASTAFGIGMTVVFGPAIERGVSKLLNPETHEVARRFATAGAKFMIAEACEHSMKRAVTEVAEFSDASREEMKKRIDQIKNKEKKDDTSAEKQEEAQDPKPGVKARNVKEAKK